MSKLADQLRQLKIFNNHELLRRFGDQDCVAIEYHRPPAGRLGWCESCRTQVWSVFKNPKLSVETALSSVFSKTFLGNRSESYYAARNWAMEQFGHDYVPSPFGGLIPKHLHHKAKRVALETALREVEK